MAVCSAYSPVHRGFVLVPGAGVEPAQYFYRGILSPLRLPISPSGHSGWIFRLPTQFSWNLTLEGYRLLKRHPGTIEHYGG